MGTRGYYVFRYKNKWYVFYNHFDSYPSGLGNAIVHELRSINLEKLKEYIENIKDEDVNTGGSAKFTSLMSAVESPNDYCFDFIQDKQTHLEDGDVEYIYTIDLDNDMFHVEYYTESTKNTQRFGIHSIPEDWETFII